MEKFVWLALENRKYLWLKLVATSVTLSQPHNAEKIDCALLKCCTDALVVPMIREYKNCLNRQGLQKCGLRYYLHSRAIYVLRRKELEGHIVIALALLLHLLLVN